MTRTKSFVALLALVGFTLVAADLDGKWSAQVPGRQGQVRDATFTFKADGEKLTGSMTGMQGNELPISEGKVNGDTISFVVTIDRGGNTIRQTFTGKVAGDEIQFKREGGQGPAREFTAKRAK